MFKFDHVALSVKKLPETIEFYNFFGFKVFNKWESDDKTLRILMLKDKDNEYIELFNYSNYTESPEYTNSTVTDLPVIGTKHMAFRVKDIESIKEVIENNGLGENIKINIGRLGRKYFFIKDPNDILLEIIEES